MKRKLQAIAPEETILERVTAREYKFVVAIKADERQCVEHNPPKEELFGTWVAWGWTTRRDLAIKKLKEARNLGYEARIAPVILRFPIQ
tara:strand:+ start:323 stop:589 length:267 start_codon:yes stop_codon:yes gene_type:complete